MLSSRFAPLLLPLVVFGDPALDARHPGAADPVLDFAGPPGSGKPFLAPTHAGGLLLTWFEPRDSGRFALRIAERRGGRWSSAITVAERDNFFVNWADFPSVVETSDGRWVVHWLEKTAAKTYAYHVRVSTSADRGRTWTAPATPHRDRSETEHGFVAMLPRSDGGADLLWLDGRQAALGPGPMSLAAGSIERDGRAGPDRILDTRVCDCCQTALARTSEGLIAVYRDRTVEEVRDIYLMRQVKGGWTDPVPVANDGWVYQACPVNGPAIAASGQDVVVAWYTEGGGSPRVSLARSGDAGARFAAPLRMDDGAPLGRAEVELAADGAAVVIWLERVRDAAAWRVKRVTRDGRVTGSWTLAPVPATRAAGFARAALLGRTLFLASTDSQPAGGVRIHRLDLW
ncbi:MAG: sialidase family protein [Gemmatimonadales bacterium]